MNHSDRSVIGAAYAAAAAVPLTSENALSHVRGTIPALVLAGAGIPVTPVDSMLRPVAGPMLAPRLIEAHFRAYPLSFLSFDPTQSGLIVLVADSTRMERRLMVGHGTLPIVPTLRTYLSSRSKLYHYGNDDVSVLVHSLQGRKQVRGVEPLGEHQGNMLYIADHFFVPHALVHFLATDPDLRAVFQSARYGDME